MSKMELNDPVNCFVYKMNSMTKVLHLRNTKYNNPHGLADRSNKSTPSDLCNLALAALKDPLFSEIVNTRYGVAKVVCRDLQIRSLKWENSNRLLA